MRLMSAAEKKKVLSSTRTLLDAGLMGSKRAMMIIRNYSWEILMHKLASKEGLIALEIYPINLIKNGEKIGVFFVEEIFYE